MRVISLAYQPLILNTIGEKPTVPLVPTMTPNNEAWRDTDILIGQWALNYPDNKLYIRSKNGIEQMLTSTTTDIIFIKDLADVDFTNHANIAEIKLLHYNETTNKVELISSTNLAIDGGNW